MTKKIILISSILAVSVLIAGAVIIFGPSNVDAAAADSKKIGGGCQTICSPYIGEDGTWENGCFVTCGHPND